MQPGDAVAEAIYAITDGIPFYNLGAVYQIISGAHCTCIAPCPDPNQTLTLVYQIISGVCGLDTANPNP